MDEIPEPTVLILDPNDENIILGIPEDVDPSTLAQGESQSVKLTIDGGGAMERGILLLCAPFLYL